MAEQSSGSTPHKSADQVEKSDARRNAEERTAHRGSAGGRNKSEGSKHQASVEMTWHSPAVKMETGSGDDIHPATGRSLEYVSGPGRSNFRENFYATDAVNSLDHLAHTMEPRNQFD